jgi:hypothetical protein
VLDQGSACRPACGERTGSLSHRCLRACPYQLIVDLRAAKMGSSHYPVCPKPAITLSRKGLAFVREQSGSVTVPGTKRASGSCPAGCMAEVGLWWWRRTTPHQRNGGSRCQDLPIRSSSFCPRLRDAMIAESTCRQTSHYPVCRKASNNIIQQGLAFVRERSGSVTVPDTKRASGSCPAGCMAEVGLWWWRQ